MDGGDTDKTEAEADELPLLLALPPPPPHIGCNQVGKHPSIPLPPISLLLFPFFDESSSVRFTMVSIAVEGIWMSQSITADAFESKF